MKFLIDQNRSPHLAKLLREAGHDAMHASEMGLERSDEQAAVILRHLDDVADDLDGGSVLVINDDRIRVRHLPLISDD